ncbi:MAG: TrkA family potassium uptake protein [Gemmatimonadetes bacterium]|nr:TrkA family potassium uptake protein [Gemmatimonadota bacterium]
MKRFVVIGLGRFGSWVAQALYEQGFEVIAVDTNEALVDRYTAKVTRAVVADGTEPDTLRQIGAEDADAGVISTGNDLAASILAAMALREVGVERLYAKVSSVRAARAMERFEIDELIFPERESAERIARRLASTTVLDYVQLGEGYSIQEIAIPDAWLGRSLRELALPSRHGVQIVALYDVLADRWNVVPDADAPLTESDIAIVAGDDETLARMTRGIEGGGKRR